GIRFILVSSISCIGPLGEWVVRRAETMVLFLQREQSGSFLPGSFLRECFSPALSCPARPHCLFFSIFHP
ncbi:MAG: hypothetical protein ACRC7G_09295, partial [Beijerinckiaceae bacterium]